MTLAKLVKSTPRLIFCITKAACFSYTEAEFSVRAHRKGDNASSEAANCYGGNLNVIRDAIKRRHAIKRAFGKYGAK